MKEAFDYKFELAVKEIDVLQNGIRNYDVMLLTIKGWAITLCSAFVLFAGKERRPEYFVFCGAAILLFWWLDATYKKFQRKYIIRFNRLEHLLRGDEFSQAVIRQSLDSFCIPDVGARVSVPDRAKKISALRGVIYPHNSLVYITLLVLVSVMYLNLVP